MLLEVGDKIRIKNEFTDFVVEIERVTKTKAVTKAYNAQGSKYEFDREYSDREYMTLKNKSNRFNTTDYFLIN